MTRQRIRDCLFGAAVAVSVVALAGAAHGCFFGIQLMIDDGRPYHRPVGLDGAIVGAALWVLFGGLPAALVGAVVGFFVGRDTNNPERNV